MQKRQHQLSLGLEVTREKSRGPLVLHTGSFKEQVQKQILGYCTPESSNILHETFTLQVPSAPMAGLRKPDAIQSIVAGGPKNLHFGHLNRLETSRVLAMKTPTKSWPYS